MSVSVLKPSTWESKLSKPWDTRINQPLYVDSLNGDGEMYPDGIANYLNGFFATISEIRGHIAGYLKTVMLISELQAQASLVSCKTASTEQTSSFTQQKLKAVKIFFLLSLIIIIFQTNTNKHTHNNKTKWT